MRHKGFTLVELAIALVIIGLLLGALLKGQEMIVQGRVKNAIAEFSEGAVAFICHNASCTAPSTPSA